MCSRVVTTRAWTIRAFVQVPTAQSHIISASYRRAPVDKIRWKARKQRKTGATTSNARAHSFMFIFRWNACRLYYLVRLCRRSRLRRIKCSNAFFLIFHQIRHSHVSSGEKVLQLWVGKNNFHSWNPLEACKSSVFFRHQCAAFEKDIREF